MLETLWVHLPIFSVRSQVPTPPAGHYADPKSSTPAPGTTPKPQVGYDYEHHPWWPMATPPGPGTLAPPPTKLGTSRLERLKHSKVVKRAAVKWIHTDRASSTGSISACRHVQVKYTKRSLWLKDTKEACALMVDPHVCRLAGHQP